MSEKVEVDLAVFSSPCSTFFSYDHLDFSEMFGFSYLLPLGWDFTVLRFSNETLMMEVRCIIDASFENLSTVKKIPSFPT